VTAGHRGKRDARVAGTVTLSFAGDIYATRRSTEAFTSDPAFLAAPAALLRRADVSFANLEGPLLSGGTALFSSVPRQTTKPGPRARRVMTDNGGYVIYAPTGESRSL